MKKVGDAEDYFHLKSSGNVDSIPACWKNLEKPQRREVAIIFGLFYNKSLGDRNKEP